MTSSELDLTGARVTLMGLGGFGGGLGAAQWLSAQGADLLITDLRSEDQLQRPLEALRPQIEAAQVSLRLGEHNVSDFTTPDLVVASPAIPTPWDNRFLRAAQAARVPITTEIRLLVDRLPERARVIGVTGTAGKSTTASMIHHVAATAGNRVHLGGNLGGSLLACLNSIGAEDWVILELSSAQLYWLGSGAGDRNWPGWSPGIAVVTNFAPNHLDWHDSLEHYLRSKQQILRDQLAGDRRVLPPELKPWDRSHAKVAVTSHPLQARESDAVPPLAIPGAHNRLNAALASLTIQAMGGFDLDSACEALGTFAGLAHRLQLVGTYRISGGGVVRAFDDSKCTTPQAAALAVDSFSHRQGEVGLERVHLICGGFDKKVDLGPLSRAAAQCVKAYTVGATGHELESAIRRAGGDAVNARDLDHAVNEACAHATDGDVILLSPGCASWDQFMSYEERGDRFAAFMAAAARVPGAPPPIGAAAP